MAASVTLSEAAALSVSQGWRRRAASPAAVLPDSAAASHGGLVRLSAPVVAPAVTLSRMVSAPLPRRCRPSRRRRSHPGEHGHVHAAPGCPNGARRHDRGLAVRAAPPFMSWHRRRRRWPGRHVDACSRRSSRPSPRPSRRRVRTPTPPVNTKGLIAAPPRRRWRSRSGPPAPTALALPLADARRQRRACRRRRRRRGPPVALTVIVNEDACASATVSLLVALPLARHAVP